MLTERLFLIKLTLKELNMPLIVYGTYFSARFSDDICIELKLTWNFEVDQHCEPVAIDWAPIYLYAIQTYEH